MYKFYFFLLAIMNVTGVYLTFADEIRVLSVIALPSAFLALIGLFGYVFKKAIFKKKAWLYILVIDIILSIVDIIYAFLDTNVQEMLVFLLFVSIASLPLYYALYQYYKNFDSLNEVDPKNIILPIKLMIAINYIIIFVLITTTLLYIDTEVRIRKIYKIFNSKQYEKAYNLSTDFIQEMSYNEMEDPTLAKAYYIKGAVLIIQNNVEEARLVFKKIWTINSNFDLFISNTNIRKVLFESKKAFLKKKD